MKSKVILFCVWLFCSQIVESIPYSEDPVRQRVYQQSNWQENANEPKQLPNTDFAQTQHENIQTYPENQGRHKYESYGNNNNPILLAPGPVKDYRNQNWQSQNQFNANEGINTAHDIPLVTRESLPGPSHYPPNSPSTILQYYQAGRKPTLRADPNPYPQAINSGNNNRYDVNSALQLGSSIPTDDGNNEESDGIRRISGSNSYGDSSANHGFDNGAETSAQKYENKRRQVGNHGSNFGPIMAMPVKQYNDGSIINTWAKKNGNKNYLNNFGSHTGSSNTAHVQRLNDGASMINDNLEDNTGKIKFAHYGSVSGLGDIFDNTAGITDALLEKHGKNEYVDSYKFNSGSSNFDRPEAGTANTWTDSTGNNNNNDNYDDDYTSDFRKSHIIPHVITGHLAKKSGNIWHGENYRSDFGSSKIAPSHSYRNAPHTLGEKLINYGSDVGSSATVPVKNYNDATITDYQNKHSGTNRFVDDNEYDYGSNKPVPLVPTVTGNSENTKYFDNSGPRHGSSHDAFLSPHNHHQFRRGREKINFEKIASHPAVRNLLLTNKTSYVVIDLEGRFKIVDKLGSSTKNNPNYRILRAGNYPVGSKHAASDGPYTRQLSAYMPSNMGTNSVPMDEHALPQNVNLPANNKGPQSSLDSSKYDDYSSSTNLPSFDFDDNISPTPIPNKPNYNQSPLVSNETDHNTLSTTLPPNKPDYNISFKQLPNTADNYQTPRPASGDSSTDVTTPAYTDDSSEDGIIKISPIELPTDNVSDVPPVTSTTANPVKGPNTSDTGYNKQDEEWDNTGSPSMDTSILNKDQKYTTTTVAPSSSVSPIDNNSSDEIITDDNSYNYDTVPDQANDRINESQIATYNSLSNTDVPAKFDDYSSTTTGSSVQSDVYTGDTSSTPGDNPLESEQPTNDLIITLNINNDSEDDTITIIIEVSESTGDADDADDADSSSDEKTVEVKIDTQDGSDDDPKPRNKKNGNCKKDQSTDDKNKGRNLEIDVFNLKGEPTVWVKTTDEDLIDKLTTDDESSVVYFFSMQPQVRVETEKHTTKHCNGTVVVEVTKSTWNYKDDPFPKIVKTTKFINPK